MKFIQIYTNRMLNLLNACCLRVREVSGSEVKRKQLLSVRCHSPVPVASLTNEPKWYYIEALIKHNSIPQP